MASRRQWHLSVLSAVVGAALLAACGGGDSEPSVTRVVAFGDSLTDLGAYTPATQIPLGQAAGVAPFFGGRFTTNTFTGYSASSNSNTATIWVEWVAARFGVAITPHEVGFGPQTVKCPAAATSPALASSCTGYAQGGSRVTSPAGIGNPNGNGINGTSPAPMTRPMVTQVADHLARFSGFSSNDIVFVFGGNNDMFVLLGAVGAAQLAPDAAVAAAQATAGELAALVKDQILAKGATRVAVMTLPDASATPGFSGLDAATKGLLSQLSGAFNAALLSGLAGTPVQVIDTRALFADLIASPAKYGISNATGTACDPAKVAAVTGGRVTDGSSLFCNASSASAFVAPIPVLNALRAGASASTWAFADGVHPTTGGHKILGDYVSSKLKDFGWLAANQ
jgi:phospholipase/lecithinase/hemolysin